MYNIRTNVLLDKNTHSLLRLIAKEEGKSIGQLIREAINKIYKKDKIKERMLIRDQVEKYRVIQKGKIDYKKLIEEGRKY